MAHMAMDFGLNVKSLGNETVIRTPHVGLRTSLATLLFLLIGKYLKGFVSRHFMAL